MAIKLFAVLYDFLSADHLSYFNELVVVISALKEGFFLEHHASEHASCGPNI